MRWRRVSDFVRKDDLHVHLTGKDATDTTKPSWLVTRDGGMG